MLDEEFIPIAIRELERLKGLADRAISQLPADRLFEIPGDGDNSVAVIMKHVGGNMCSRWRDFLTSDGEKPDRRRDLEFVIAPDDSRDAVLARWNEGWAVLFAALAPTAAQSVQPPARAPARAWVRGQAADVAGAVPGRSSTWRSILPARDGKP